MPCHHKQQRGDEPSNHSYIQPYQNNSTTVNNNRLTQVIRLDSTYPNPYINHTHSSTNSHSFNSTQQVSFKVIFTRTLK
ncbi:hypothetical protein L1987_51213 [Smallanthus sonchifolius]|uniref:Uncharacterized protein n=1 Tax=Smallanthus sonchifolius TaxID=185202 RepID=A0ACB9EPE3_9ASTR|nr:hypothetical protein L1987_51213 [Smallanthus sonchifolius]